MSIESILASFLSQNTGDNSAQREKGFDLAYNIIGFCLFVWFVGLVCPKSVGTMFWNLSQGVMVRVHSRGSC